MLSAEKDGNIEASLETAHTIRVLLLGRLFAVKFLNSNKEEDANRTIKEFNLLKTELSHVQKTIQNPDRQKDLAQAIELINIYNKGLNDVVTNITEKNKAIDNLRIIGPKIAKLSEDIKLSIKKDQGIIGPEVADLNDNILKTSIIIAIVVLSLVLLSAFIISREISSKIEKFQEGLLGFFKYLNRESSSEERLDDSRKNEIGIMAKVVNENIRKTIELINNVEAASKEQQSGIEQINDAVTIQDQQTQKIASAANETQEIAVHTSHISENIVKKVNEKEFKGKDIVVDRRENQLDLNYDTSKDRRKSENKIRKMKGEKNTKPKEIIANNNYQDKNDDEWESF